MNPSNPLDTIYYIKLPEGFSLSRNAMGQIGLGHGLPVGILGGHLLNDQHILAGQGEFCVDLPYEVLVYIRLLQVEPVQSAHDSDQSVARQPLTSSRVLRR